MTSSTHTSAPPSTSAASSAMSEEFAYLNDLRRHHLSGALKFALAMPLAMHRGGAPRDALAVARLVAVLHEDCGPCAQITIDQSLKAGVPPALLRQVLDGRTDELSPELAAVYRLADATVRADPMAGDLSREVERVLGRKTLASLALAIASVRLFPTVKRALGYARSCSQVRVELPDGVQRKADGST